MRVSVGEALRFFLELGSIVALGYWGVHASKDLPVQAVLAVGAPVALIVIWALFIAPRAVYPIPRLAQEGATKNARMRAASVAGSRNVVSPTRRWSPP